MCTSEKKKNTSALNADKKEGILALFTSIHSSFNHSLYKEENVVGPGR